MDPEPDEPAARRRPVPRDRIWVHAVWELLLAAAVVGAVLAVRAQDADALTGAGLQDLLVLLAAGILLGSAFALSLRAAVPNLAVGAVAVTAGTLTGWLVAEHGYDWEVAALVTLGAAVALGIALAIVVVGLRTPAWAVGLGAALGLYAAVLSLSAGRSVLVEGGPELRDWAWPLAIGAAVLSVLGGALALPSRMRAAVGRYRPDGDPAGRRAPGSALPAAAALALLGGTRAYGRRGGVLGTVLAAAFLQLAALWLVLIEAQPWSLPALLGGAIVVGLLVGRVVEAVGSQREPEPEPDEEDDVGPETEMWDPYSTGSFTADPYPTGSFTPASAYRPDAGPHWPGQAPGPEPR